MLRNGLMGLAAAAALAAAAVPALACTCDCRGDGERFVRETPLFFRGRAVAEAQEGNVRRYTMQVTAVLKGELPARIELRTPASSAACGVVLAIGQEVLIAAHPSAEGPQTNLCTHVCVEQNRREVERLLALCKPGAPCPPER